MLNVFLLSRTQAQVRLPRLVSDRMVLQRDVPLTIWGQSNTKHPQHYTQLLPALIADWRQQWNRSGATAGPFPFLYVQLANYLPTTDQPSESNWAELREAQRKTLMVPNTAMAVISNVGEWNDIHPLDKQTVGQRLARAAEKVAYDDQKVVYSGPLYQSLQRDGNRVLLRFSNVGSGLVASDGQALRQFAIAGADKKLVWAKAEIKGNQVILWSDPVVVRYAWADNPRGANLYNREGLPASPFSTSP